MKRGLIYVALLGISACTPLWQTRPSEPAEQLWQSRQQQLQSLNSWEFTGRTVIIQDKKGWNAGIHWQQTASEYHIRLSGPFAQGGVLLDGTDTQVKLTMVNGKTMTSATPEALVAKSLGVVLPVSALHDWVRGVPYHKARIDTMKLDADGRLSHLQQMGWDIEYRRYIPFENMSMPAKIFIKKGNVSVRLVISSWDRP